MAFKRTVTYRASFRFPTIRFDAPTPKSFRGFTDAHIKCPPQERLLEKVHATIPKGIVGDFSSLFLKEISKNCTRSHGRMFFLSAEGKQLK